MTASALGQDRVELVTQASRRLDRPDGPVDYSVLRICAASQRRPFVDGDQPVPPRHSLARDEDRREQGRIAEGRPLVFPVASHVDLAPDFQCLSHSSDLPQFPEADRERVLWGRKPVFWTGCHQTVTPTFARVPSRAGRALGPALSIATASHGRETTRDRTSAGTLGMDLIRAGRPLSGERPCPASRSRQGALAARHPPGEGANPSNPSALLSLPLVALNGRGVFERTAVRRSDAPSLRGETVAIRGLRRSGLDFSLGNGEPAPPRTYSSEPSAIRIERHAANRRAISVSPIRRHSVSHLLSFAAAPAAPARLSARTAKERM